MKQPVLEISHMEVSYKSKPVVHDINLSVSQGEILGIVGESGSGKSTVIKAAMGLLGNDGAVTKGDVFYKENNMIDINATALQAIRGCEMAMIFQNTSASLCPIRTIESQLYESVLEHTDISKEEIKKQALCLLEKMRLTDGERILKSYPFELSGGMSQRIGIMMAMILRPRVLFADEPTSALDVTVQAQVLKEMLWMRKEFNTSIILVSHNIGVIEKMADTIAVMQGGRIIEYGLKDAVMNHPKEAYTKELLSSVLRLKNRG